MRSVVAAAFLLIATPLCAATITVSQNADDGTGSLRWALLQANAMPGPDTIVFSQSPMTIRLASPLPPITEQVTIGTPDGFFFHWRAAIIIDGTAAGDADGLVINASSVVIRGLAFINFNGDGIVVNGDDGDLSFLTLTANRNGARISGRNNALYASRIENNHAAGVWVTSEASGNTISRNESPPNQLVPWDPYPSDTDLIAGNRDGIVLDGPQNTVFGATITSEPSDGAYETVPANSGAGVVVNGAHNWVVQAEISGNGGNGITVNVPAEVSRTTGSCNGGPLVAGSNEAAPRLLSAVREGSAATVDGTLDALPSSDYTIELFDLELNCNPGAMTFGDVFLVSTDASGHAAFHHSSEMGGANVVATATRARTTDLNSSPLSASFPTTTNPTPFADVAVSVTGPSTAATGGLVTLNMTMTNLGPAAATYVDLGYSFPESLVTRTSGSDCREAPCRAMVLGVGDSKTFPVTFRVVGQTPRLDFTVRATSSPSLGVPDPNLANNTVAVSVEVVSRTRAVHH